MAKTSRLLDRALPVFDGPQAWFGPEMAKRRDWIYELNREELAEIDSAVAACVERRTSLVAMTAADFPLPRLASRLAELRAKVLHGAGFCLLRGVPVERYDALEAALLFRGIGAHWGEALSQNGKGHVLGHVADLGVNLNDASARGYQSKAELRFHVDGGDVVALLCLKPAKSGGLSRIASSTTVWNQIVRRRPDLAAELLAPFHLSRWGEVGAGQQRSAKLRLFSPCAGRLMVVYIMSAIEKAQAFDEVPRLTGAQAEALALVNTLAGDDAIRLDMDFRPGDTQFLCNHSILHARTDYEDHPEPQRRRHLLRQWFGCADGPELPADVLHGFQGATASGRPAGIRVPGVPLSAPLQPE